VFQTLGVGLYMLTGSLTWPLMIAAGSLVWAAWQMMGVAPGRMTVADLGVRKD
jgi:hypothetical protein